MSIRSEKVASAIKRAIAKDIADIALFNSAGIVTVSSVRMSDDLHIAKIYFSIFNSKISVDSFISILEKNKSELKRIIARQVRLRYTPDIKFFIDDTLDQIDHIQNLLDSVNFKKDE